VIQDLLEAARREQTGVGKLRIPVARDAAASADGTGPHDATVTALAQAVPYRWDRSPAGQVSEQTPDEGR
jgi:hypothetical protein